MTTTVREFSCAGPCIKLGTFVKRTRTGIAFVNRDGKLERRQGERVRLGLIHTEPCHSCRDADGTMYPQGYMD